MAFLLVIAAFAVLGYVVAFPFVYRGFKDVSRIPGPIWRVTGYRNRKSWRIAILGGFLLGGWPGALVVMKWRYGEEREVLRDEWRLLIEERRARHEIVLAHHEEAPDEAEQPG